jgi:hypothetical protein
METCGHVQRPGVVRRGVRVIWRKLDCLNPNAVDAKPGVGIQNSLICAAQLVIAEAALAVPIGGVRARLTEALPRSVTTTAHLA